MLALGDGWLVYSGPLAPTDVHAHHAHQVLLASPGRGVLVDGTGDRATGEAAIVPADAPHAIGSDTDRAVLVFVEPEARDGRALLRLGIPRTPASAWFDAAAPLAPLEWHHPSTFDEAAALAGTVLARVGAGARIRRSEPTHPAVTAALARLHDASFEEPVRVAGLAAEVGISASRLSHVFTREVGVTLRRYVLWLRLQRAAAHVGAGADLTRAAHAAGFSDSAHLHRTFRRMFGLAPSDVLGAVRWLLPER